jgi:hypothetical protein
MSAVLLVILGALSRLLPHVPNATAVAALALFSGARLPKKPWAYLLPLAAMALSDFFLDFGTGRGVLTPVRFAVYGSFVLAVLLGRRLQGRAGAGRTAAFALGSSVLFFAVTNFAVWASAAAIYPPTTAGLAACYAAALPFFRNEVVGTLAWTGVLFGLDALARRRSGAYPFASLASAARSSSPLAPQPLFPSGIDGRKRS